MMYLVIVKVGEVLDMGTLCWTSALERVVVPHRDPDRFSAGTSGWKIAYEKRRVMGQAVMANIESANRESLSGHNTEETYCFYDLIRLGRKWVEQRDVEWWLVQTVTREEEVRRWFPR